MTTVKLTLSADGNIVRKFKRYAKGRNTSVSALVGKYMASQVESEKEDLDLDKLPPLTRSALGIAKLPEGKTDRELLEEALMEKFGLDK